MTDVVPVVVEDEPEIPLDEYIAMLTRLRSDEDFDDVPGVCGALGDAWSERYLSDQEDGSLVTALGYYTEAVEAAPEHEDRMRWWFWLGVGYDELGARRRSVADYDRAAYWLTKVIDELPEADADFDGVLVVWMETTWDRYQLVRYWSTSDGVRHREEAERLVTDLSGRVVGGRDTNSWYLARLFLGLAHLERYTLTNQRSDLDQGTAALVEATPRVAADTGPLHLARAELVNAYLRLADLDDDPRLLDPAIEAGEEATEAIVDESDRLLVRVHQADAYRQRWRQREDPADLDRAIGCFRELLGDDPAGWAGTNCGDLLRERTAQTGDPADIIQAVELLERAAAATPDHDDPWEPLYDLGQAYHRYADLLDAPQHRYEAVRCFDRALELGVPDDNMRLIVHNARLSAAMDAVRAEAMAPHAQAPPSATRVRELLVESGAALDEAGAADLTTRAVLAGMLGGTEMWVAGYDLGAVDAARVLRRLDLGRQLPDAPVDWVAMMDAMTGLMRYSSDMASIGRSGEEGLAAFTQALLIPGLDGSIRATLREILPVLQQGRASRSGDLRARQSASSMIGQPIHSTGAAAETTNDDQLLISCIVTALERDLAGDLDGFHGLARQANDIIAWLSPSAYSEQILKPFNGLIQQMSALLEGRAIEPVEPRRVAGASSAFDPQLDVMKQVMAIGVGFARAVQHGDVAGIRESAEQLDALGDLAHPDHIARLGICHLAGTSWLEVSRRDRADRTAPSRAARWYAEAVETAGGETHPLWGTWALGLAESMRLAGDPDRALTRRLGRSALRGRARQVLLQAGTDEAIQAAREAADEADKVIGWCLADRAYDELVPVLDAGRALVLGAATFSRGVPQQLAAEGYPELAAEWEATAGLGRDRVTGQALDVLAGATEFPDDLRERALRALRADSLVDDVPVVDVRRALSTVGADALVYLVPATVNCPGTAVLVPVDEAIETLSMPGLAAGPNSPIATWIGASPGTRDVLPVAGAVDDSLDGICRWAWQECVGALVERTKRWRLRRPARLVLVPKGMLGLVPWHAAYTADSGGRYAVTDLVFSYTSRRAGSAPVPRTRSGPSTRRSLSATLVTTLRSPESKRWRCTSASTGTARTSAPGRGPRPPDCRPMSSTGSAERQARRCCTSPAMARWTRGSPPTRT